MILLALALVALGAVAHGPGVQPGEPPKSSQSPGLPSAGVRQDEGAGLPERVDQLEAEDRWLERLRHRSLPPGRQLALDRAFRERLAGVLRDVAPLKPEEARSTETEDSIETVWELYVKTSTIDIADASTAVHDVVRLRLERLGVAELVDSRGALPIRQDDLGQVAQLALLAPRRNFTTTSGAGSSLRSTGAGSFGEGTTDVRQAFLGFLKSTDMSMRRHASSGEGPASKVLDSLLQTLVQGDDLVLAFGVAEILFPIRPTPQDGLAPSDGKVARSGLWSPALKTIAVGELCEPLLVAMGVCRNDEGREYDSVLSTLKNLSRRLDPVDLQKQLSSRWAPIQFELSNWIRQPATRGSEDEPWRLVEFAAGRDEGPLDVSSSGDIKITRLDWLTAGGRTKDFLPFYEELNRLDLPLVLPAGHYRITLSNVADLSAQPAAAPAVTLIAKVQGVELTKISVPSIVPSGDFAALACIQSPQLDGLILTPPIGRLQAIDSLQSTVEGMNNENRNFQRLRTIVDRFGNWTNLSEFPVEPAVMPAADVSRPKRSAALEGAKEWLSAIRDIAAGETQHGHAAAPPFLIQGGTAKQNADHMDEFVRELQGVTFGGSQATFVLPRTAGESTPGRYALAPSYLAHQLLSEHAQIGDPLDLIGEFGLVCADRQDGPLHMSNVGQPTPVPRSRNTDTVSARSAAPLPKSILVRFVVVPGAN